MKSLKEKINQFQKYLCAEGIKYSLFINMDDDKFDPNFFYLSGFRGYGLLVVGQKGKLKLYVNSMEYLRAKKSYPWVSVVKCSNSLIKQIKKDFKIGKRDKLGVDLSALTCVALNKLKQAVTCEFRDVSTALVCLRKTKTSQEIIKIKKACKITDEIMQSMFWNFKKFKTETDVEAFLVSCAISRGVELSFKPIVMAGKQGMPHFKARNVKLCKGFLVIDFGIRVDGYCSDMTRTIYLGTPLVKEVELYYLILNTQQKSIESVSKGIHFLELHENAASFLGKYSNKFIHGLGHGVGIQIHEAPHVKPKKGIDPKNALGDMLEKGDIITIEPGIYAPGKYSIRIEDTILVTENGCEILTKTGKNLLIIK
ncbi:aminopeptidase P family protein [Candidatus Woesearchaeota archaeon]|jgi:Xaa-Pro aminopeptidase|nr:aminopeptidase P family protein [Candidatus Woesearchaeota archaeon]